MVDQQQDLLLQIVVQNSCYSSYFIQPNNTVSQATLPLQSISTATLSSSLQEETKDDDYNFINSLSWISLISERSTETQRQTLSTTELMCCNHII